MQDKSPVPGLKGIPCLAGRGDAMLAAGCLLVLNEEAASAALDQAAKYGPPRVGGEPALLQSVLQVGAYVNAVEVQAWLV